MIDPKHPDDFGYTAEGVVQWQRAKIKFQADEIERLRDALQDVVDWAEDLQIYAEPEHHMHPVFYKARAALGEKE